MSGVVGYVVVALISILVGSGELAGRYKDSVGRSLTRPASSIYLITNAGASLAALAIIRTFGWTFGQEGDKRELLQVLAAGLGALALFRTKLFASAEQDNKVNWSPAGLLEKILAITDRQVDRDQARRRNRSVPNIMAGVDFERALGPLPAYALALLENPTKEEQKELASDVKALAADKKTVSEGKGSLARCSDNPSNRS